MSKRKSCIKCGRSIDEFARVCPYCNWWQSQPVPAAVPAAAVEPSTSSLLDPRARTGILSALTFGFLLMVAFTIGALFHGAQPASAAQPASSAPLQPASAHAIVTLVPVTEAPPPPATDAPITTIPLQDTTKTLAPSDATALPSQQYAAAAEQLRRQQQQQQAGSVIDPRSITGAPAYEAPVAARPARRAVSDIDTQPFAVYQPVPNVRVDRVQTAQLSLVVGTDGRVHDIDIRRAAPDVMAELIGAVQQWRFRPAMQNGQPVSARFSVNVTFQP